jgi:hypothetical protein
MEQIGVGDRMAGQNAKRFGIAGIEHGISDFFEPFDWSSGEGTCHSHVRSIPRHR